MTQKLGFNPWISIWTNPRRTIRAIIDSNPMKGFFYLASITAIQSFFFIVGYYSYGFSTKFVILLISAIVLSPFLGAVWFYFFGWILYFTGKWLKGTGSYAEIRCAFAWSKIPLIINILIWFIILVFSSKLIFANYLTGASLIFINMIFLITGVWSFVLLVQNLREVQTFTVLRALVNIILAYIGYFIIVCIASFIFGIIFNSFFLPKG